MDISLTVNGAHCDLDVEPRLLLVDALREHLGLTGAHSACDQGVCGTCTVLYDGTAIRSCLLFAVQADGHSITTIEGVGTPQQMHPVQEALAAHHGLQCGFCTPGMVLSAIDLLRSADSLTEAEIEEGMSGNLCRCTGYVGIVDAIVQCAGDPASTATSAAAGSSAER